MPTVIAESPRFLLTRSAIRTIHVKQATAGERDVAAVMRQFFKRCIADVASKLSSREKRGLVPSVKTFKSQAADLAHEIFDSKKWDKLLIATMRPQYRKLLVRGAVSELAMHDVALKRFDSPWLKFNKSNECHDEHGRFCSGGMVAGGSGDGDGSGGSYHSDSGNESRTDIRIDTFDKKEKQLIESGLKEFGINGDNARAMIGAPPHGERRISDLMKSNEGRSFWEKSGKSVDLQFDLSAGSTSRKVLDEYVSRKGYKRKSARPKEYLSAGEPNDFDEELLDLIWDEIGGKVISDHVSGKFFSKARGGRLRDDIDIPTDLPDWLLEAIEEELDEVFDQDYWLAINETTRDGIQRVLRDGIEDGASIRDLRDAILDKFGDEYTKARATNVARTESSSALNHGHLLSMKKIAEDSGLVAGKEWLSVLGTTTRPTHAAADGQQTEGVDAMFEVGGYLCPYPAHWSLPAEERCQCQCSFISTGLADYIPDDEDGEGDDEEDGDGKSYGGTNVMAKLLEAKSCFAAARFTAGADSIDEMLAVKGNDCHDESGHFCSGSGGGSGGSSRADVGSSADVKPATLKSHKKDSEYAEAFNEQLASKKPEDLKVRTMNSIGDRLNKSIDEETLRAFNLDNARPKYLVNEDLSPSHVAAATLTDQWSSTSGDSEPLAVAMQIATRKELGLSSDSHDVPPSSDSDTVREGRELYEQHSTVLRGYARAQYEATQEKFANDQVTHVTLYRGMAFESQREGAAVFGDSQWKGVAEVTHQPMSSYSMSYSTAYEFARQGDSNSPAAMIGIRVPVARILSTPFTGAGCASESECIVLGGKYDAHVHYSDKAYRIAGTPEKFFEK